MRQHSEFELSALLWGPQLSWRSVSAPVRGSACCLAAVEGPLSVATTMETTTALARACGSEIARVKMLHSLAACAMAMELEEWKVMSSVAGSVVVTRSAVRSAREWVRCSAHR